MCRNNARFTENSKAHDFQFYLCQSFCDKPHQQDNDNDNDDASNENQGVTFFANSTLEYLTKKLMVSSSKNDGAAFFCFQKQVWRIAILKHTYKLIFEHENRLKMSTTFLQMKTWKKWHSDFFTTKIIS